MNKFFNPAWFLCFIMVNSIGYGAGKSPGPFIPAGSSQMILVIGAGWDDLHSRLYLCEKNNGKWEIQNHFPAVCGKKGMAWGLGLYPADTGAGWRPVKTEGDLKSPAGIFQLGECRGYAPELLINPGLDYRRLTGSVQGVDDPASQYYNRLIDTTDFKDQANIDWKSFEKMKRADNLYKWLIVVKHNPDNIPGKGSLIFIHVWKDRDCGTAGCTALDEQNLLQVLKWLGKEKNPVLVQLPQEVYNENRADWGFPLITGVNAQDR